MGQSLSLCCAFQVREMPRDPGPLRQWSARSFVEPKTEDAPRPHEDFQVVWLPQLDFSPVAHKATCEVECLGVARPGKRLEFESMSSMSRGSSLPPSQMQFTLPRKPHDFPLWTMMDHG
jgi:hypothetical protein